MPVIHAKLPVPVIDQSAVKARGNFYVSGGYGGAPGNQVMSGQAYVEILVPHEVRRPYPLVLIHGAGQTSACWFQTPDGRMGWADFFVAQGYVVYVMDQPMRGRSAWHPGDGATRVMTVAQAETQLTASITSAAWPQAKLHTQWPGDGPNSGRQGDAVFDAFYASQVESVASDETTSLRNRLAGAALLDKIGPAILLTHSQSGSLGWLIADERPELVKAILAVEPSGPPFGSLRGATATGHVWGVTATEMTYEPAARAASDMAVTVEAFADRPDLIVCNLQEEPARQLVNLAKVPVMVMTGEASYHAYFDHCTVKYLRQAGVQVEHIQLQDRDILGNGHMMMLEKNSLEIAELIDAWSLENVV